MKYNAQIKIKTNIYIFFFSTIYFTWRFDQIWKIREIFLNKLIRCLLRIAIINLEKNLEIQRECDLLERTWTIRVIKIIDKQISGNGQCYSSVLLGDNSATRGTSATVMQQGSPHPEDGILHSRSLSKCQVYLYDPRRPCHRAFHYLEKGMIEIFDLPAIPADVCKFIPLHSRILKCDVLVRVSERRKNEKKTNEREFTYFSYAKQDGGRNEMGR